MYVILLPVRGRTGEKPKGYKADAVLTYGSFSLDVLCLRAEREAACVVYLDTPPKHRLLFFDVDCMQITCLIGAHLICT